ncbi:MAG: hypothetical protein WBM99_03915 [Psychromonas sp.]
MINLKRKKLLKSLFALSIGITSLATSVMVSAAEYNWRFANLYGRGTAYGSIYEDLAKNIETMSNGRIAVQVLYSGEGVGTTGILSAVKSGLISMGAPFQSMHAGELPAGIVEIGLPGGTSDVGELSTLFHEKGWAEVLKRHTANRVWYGLTLIFNRLFISLLKMRSNRLKILKA